MNITRIAALLAVPTALSLAACSSSSQLPTVTGNTASVRIINGAPGAGPLDIYFAGVGGNPPSNPVVTALNYAVASDYLTQPAASENLYATTAGSPAPSTGAKATALCTIPQFSLNAKYSIVLVNNSGVVGCEIFQDFDYTGSPQYRVHNAALNSLLSTTAGFGTISSPSAPPGTPFTVQVVGPQGGLAGHAAGFTQAQPSSLPSFTGSITFAVGTGTTGTTPAVATLDSRYIFAPNGTSQPNTTGALNFTGSADTSIFALDCTTSPAPNVPCSGGVALVGYTDRL